MTRYDLVNEDKSIEEEWLIVAIKISQLMHEKYKKKLLTEKEEQSLALELKEKRTIFSIEKIIDDEPSFKTIRRQLDKLIGPIDEIASFGASTARAEVSKLNGQKINTELFNKVKACEAIGKAAQAWETKEREKHNKKLQMWKKSNDSKSSPKPIFRLKNHVEDPSISVDGYQNSNADFLVYRWFEQAVFIREILKTVPNDKAAPIWADELSSDVSVVGIWAKDLFHRTYPSAPLGNRYSAGYTFIIEVVKAVSGKELSHDTVHAHIRKTKQAGGQRFG